MSWQAMEAVQDHSQHDETALNIMYVIARHADKSGVAGDGGKRTSPNINTIADLSRCHKNTVLNWLPKLETSGELLIERNGAGRGSWNKYTILLPMSELIGPTQSVPLGTKNGTTQSVPLTDSELRVMVQDLVVMVQETHLMVQGMVQNGTTQDVPDTLDTKKRDTGDTKNKSCPARPEEKTPEMKPDDTPFGIFQRLQEIEPGIKKGQTLRDAKALLNGDQKRAIQPRAPVDILNCGKFLQTDPWRVENMVTLSTQAIIEKIDKWVAAGKPGTWDDNQVVCGNARHEQLTIRQRAEKAFDGDDLKDWE